jgi:hypothetical protein
MHLGIAQGRQANALDRGGVETVPVSEPAVAVAGVGRYGVS